MKHIPDVDCGDTTFYGTDICAIVVDGEDGQMVGRRCPCECHEDE